MGICVQARVKVLVFKEIGRVLKFAGGNLIGDGPVHLTKLIAGGQRSVRSHFERLVSKNLIR